MVTLDAASDEITFRVCGPTDIAVCAEIEAASYPAAEAASKSSLEYRQHHAANYFRVAVLNDTDIIGFICSTKCHEFTHESMSVHCAGARILAIHSVVVQETYRRKGIASRMLKDYIESVVQQETSRPEKIMLLAKANLLSFYVSCGFQVLRPSAIEHGDEQWYDLQLNIADADSARHPACYIVDAFCNPAKKGTGNPAAVVPLDSEPTDYAWMQTVAQEFNLSETAFCWPLVNETDGEEAAFGIRYFTPTVEVPLCGHATLATAAALYQTSLGTATIAFYARSDVLRAEKTTSNLKSTKVTMTFPTKPVTEVTLVEEKSAVQAMMKSSLGIDVTNIVYIGVSVGLGDLLVEITNDCFCSLGYGKALNVNALLEWDGYSRGVIVCCEDAAEESESKESDVNVDFLSRFFGPKAGIFEDPVTGSAHCALAQYWGQKLNKEKLIGNQLSERGGIVECELSDDGESVKITGCAVTTVTGVLWI